MAEIGNVTVKVDAVITDEQYREAMGAVRAANERINLLEAENEKLRELVEDLYFDLLGEMPESMLEGRRSQIRELGIEVWSYE